MLITLWPLHSSWESKLPNVTWAVTTQWKYEDSPFAQKPAKQKKEQETYRNNFAAIREIVVILNLPGKQHLYARKREENLRTGRFRENCSDVDHNVVHCSEMLPAIRIMRSSSSILPVRYHRQVCSWRIGAHSLRVSVMKFLRARSYIGNSRRSKVLINYTDCLPPLNVCRRTPQKVILSLLSECLTTE